jgi:hypothetical protein
VPKVKRPAPAIPWDEAVAEARQLIATADKNDWRLAQLAHEVDTAYGKNRLAEFATAIGLAHCTVERRRSTYRNWEPILKADPGLVSDLKYSVARALEKHPKREELIKANRTMSKRQATQLMEAYLDNNKTESAEERWWTGLLMRASKATMDEDFIKVPGKRQLLLKVVQSWPSKSEQVDKWIFCLTPATLAEDQEIR